MKLSPVALAAVLVLLAPATEARAELIHWAYSWSNVPDKIMADSPGTSYITTTNEPLRLAAGESDIVATNLRTFSTAPETNPDHFTAKPYTLNLFLFDIASGKSTTLPFTGQIDGTLTALSANLANTFTGQTTYTVQLGNHLYRVTIVAYTPPSPTGAQNAGSISAHAAITVITLPEPSTFALSGVGIALFALARWRRRKRQRDS
jgi:hypothetical protein